MSGNHLVSNKLHETVRNDYAVTPVTTSAFVQLVAILPSEIGEIEIWDTSGEEFILGIGAAASERDFLRFGPGGLDRQKVTLSAGQRLSIKAVSANASVGVLTMNLWG